MIRDLENEAATNAFAAEFAAALPASLAGFTVLLEGELGAGKSTFARGLMRALGHEGAVPSPTYTLIEPYELAAGSVYHVDLYRVASAEELHFLGWNELDHGMRLVEWPDRAPGLLAAADLRLTLTYAGDGRQVVAESLSAAGAELLARMHAAAV